MKKEQDLVQETSAIPGRRRFLTGTIAGAATVAGAAAMGNVNQVFAAPLPTNIAQSSCGSDQDLVLGHDLSTLQQLEDAKRPFLIMDM